MIIKCGINGEVLEENQIFICHHCGMPVCQTHGWVVASDDAFSPSAEAPSALPPAAAPPTTPAVALQQASSLLQQATAATGRAAPVPLPAMHCRECMEKFHGRAHKRHGWDEPAPLAGLPGRS